MMITLNCGWETPGEERGDDAEEAESGNGIAAIFGLHWQPAEPANDNGVKYLYVVC